MLKNFDWHHAALLIIGIAVTAGPDVASSLGSDGLIGAAGTISRIVAFLTIVLAMLKNSPMSDRPKPPDPTPPGMATRGLLLLFGLALAARALSGCAMAPATAIATAVPIVEATADLVCTTVAAVDQNEPDWFKFLCHYVDPAGTTPTAVPAPAFVVKVPAAHAYAFMKQHVPAAGL